MTYRSALVSGGLWLCLAASAAQAQPLNAAQADQILYPADRVEIVRHATPGLTDEQAATLVTVARTQRYYAALAFAPSAGIMAEPTVLSANYHSPQAARQAALAQCNARRTGGAPCAMALEVRPAGWQARSLTLSADASAAFATEYRRTRGARAMAVSAASGAWVIARGDNAETQALSACRAQSGTPDCAIVLKD